MEFTKKLNMNKSLLSNIFIFLFLIIFPFGQIIRIGIVHPLDVVVGLAGAIAIIYKYPKPDFFKYFENILLVFFFSWIFGSFIFGFPQALYGLLYLIRLSAYFYFFLYVWNFAGRSGQNRKLLLNSLLAVSVASAVFGWIQYFLIPDIKPFFTWNWDMHLFRLVGTFLDPTFLGLIIVLGLMIAIIRKKYLVVLMLLISVAFTYSRASYMALFAGILTIAWHKKFIGKAIAAGILFAGLLLLLPTSRNHSIELFRSFSAIARVENYKTTLELFSASPIFGIGYDNMCIANQKYVGPQSFTSHACSGSDSSILFILATTGVSGLIVFAYNMLLISDSLKREPDLLILGSSFSAVLVHSIFSNSLFYPWIMGWLTVLLAVYAGLRREV